MTKSSSAPSASQVLVSKRTAHKKTIKTAKSFPFELGGVQPVPVVRRPVRVVRHAQIEKQKETPPKKLAKLILPEGYNFAEDLPG